MALAQMERDRSEPLLTVEAERHADYVEEFVMHVETGTKAQTKRVRRRSSLGTLYERGQLNTDQIAAAQEIAYIAESIRRHVSIRCASLEARVDCSRGSTGRLLEHLRQVRMERAFGIWRSRIRSPRAMLIEMIVSDRALKETARRYRHAWPTALRMLKDALDSWNEVMQKVSRDIDESDLEAAYLRLARAA